MSLLTEPYYSACNGVFRGCTNQGALMLDEMEEMLRDLRQVSILSVGSGVGLFEIPMLRMLHDAGVLTSQFWTANVLSVGCAAGAQQANSDGVYDVLHGFLLAGRVQGCY